MSMLVAAQLTAWATLVLAIFAVVAAIFAFLAWRGQTEEIETLKDQLASQEELTEAQLPLLQDQKVELKDSREQREREMQERREAYASRVFIWAEAKGTYVHVNKADNTYSNDVAWTASTHIRNAGELPVYDVIFSWRIGSRMAHQENHTLPLMPDDPDVIATWELPPDTSKDSVTAVAFLRDAAGNRWRIWTNGKRDLLASEEWPPHVW